MWLEYGGKFTGFPEILKNQKDYVMNTEVNQRERETMEIWLTLKGITWGG